MFNYKIVSIFHYKSNKGGGAMSDNSNGDYCQYPVHINDILKETVLKEGSDLHLTVGAPPMSRIRGELFALDYPILMPEDMEVLIKQVLDNEQWQIFNEVKEYDFSYSLPGVARFRGNLMKQRGSIGAVFRIIPLEIPDIHKLGLPSRIKNLCDLPRGLVLVTGPTGSGKSTTLAAMINLINQKHRLNIVTIEDPIEFLHKHKKSIIKQREVGTDTNSFASALRHVLRHDPDVILIGEMRDVESISIALTAAETGHLVFSTLHTQTAPLTVSRIVDVFDGPRREQVRLQLANSLRAIISQQLLPLADGKGRVAAVEFMVDTIAIRNMIREGKEHQLYSAIQTGRAIGMQTMDQALADLVNAGRIKKDIAFEYCIDRNELERLIQGSGFDSNLNLIL